MLRSCLELFCFLSFVSLFRHLYSCIHRIYPRSVDSRRRAEHRAIFMFKCLKNLFTHSFDIVFNREYHDYNTRSKDNVHKTLSNRNWGLWNSTNFAANQWNNLDKSARELKSLDEFIKAIRNATI